jgi:hypothetical protein
MPAANLITINETSFFKICAIGSYKLLQTTTFFERLLHMTFQEQNGLEVNSALKHILEVPSPLQSL